MILCRIIAPEWFKNKFPELPAVLEGRFSLEDIQKYNKAGYNIYYRPNYPSIYETGHTVVGSDIDTFEWVFVDYDKKSNVYDSLESFVALLIDSTVPPTKIINSGNGVHAYWRVTDLDAKSFLRLSRRLMRLFKTDDAVQTLAQLMRLPDTLNTKLETERLDCYEIDYTGPRYTCEQLDKLLPPITLEDETYCNTHYDRVHNNFSSDISEELPPKFGKFLRENTEANALFAGRTSDRSKSDYRLGHLMYAHGFTKEEALSVLVNTAKALTRAPVHRASYAQNIVDKIWTFEATKDTSTLSPTVRDILKKSGDELLGVRFPCHKLIDDTHHGYRLGQVIGIIGGSGVGKTTLTLNAFLWFAKNNPEYHHFFFSLEQPVGELANRIKTICAGDESLYDKIHLVSNYDPQGNFIHFSLQTIEDHLVDFMTKTGHKVGATVIDHIGVLDKQSSNGEQDGLIGVCRRMKALAVKVNTLLIMLSQAPREKAGIGDLELNKDAAYGTVFFEAFLDFCICLWQPLKRVYQMGAPTIMAFKFAKIRHKNQKLDVIKEDVRYQLFFDPSTERLREITQDEEKSLPYWNAQAVNSRKLDKKTDILTYTSRRENEPETNTFKNH